jgi:hypothetical protein
VAPVGQLPAAPLAGWLEDGATVADVAVAAVAVVGAGGAAVEGDPPLEPPQADRVAPKTSAANADQRRLLYDT